jgi:hypothetical protein
MLERDKNAEIPEYIWETWSVESKHTCMGFEMNKSEQGQQT